MGGRGWVRMCTHTPCASKNLCEPWFPV